MGTRVISVGSTGELIIGNNLIITAESSLVVYKKIKIGNDCMFAWEVLIMDTDLHDIVNQTGAIVNAPEEIIIGNNVWICARATILKGSIIPNYAIISVNSLCNKKLEGEHAIFAGNPIHLVKTGVDWKL